MIADQTLDARRTAREQSQLAGEMARHMAELMTTSIGTWQSVLRMQCEYLRSYADAFDPLIESARDNISR